MIIKKTKNILHILLLFIGSGLILNFMFLSPIPLKHNGLVPIIPFQVDSNFYGFGLRSDDMVAKINISAMYWFSLGQSTLGFSYAGIQNGNTAASFDSILCDNNPINIPQQNQVFSQNIIDPDCSAEACTFIWSCDGNSTPRGVSIQFNSFEYSYTADQGDTDKTNLQAVALHAFGHAAGLGHCQTGDTEDQCNTIKGNGQSNPNGNSVMFQSPEKLTTLSPDDISGLQSLYGIQEIPFPSPSLQYGLSVKETQSLINYQQNLTILHGNSDFWRSSSILQQRASDLVVYYYAIRRTKESLDNEIDNWVYGNPQLPSPTDAEKAAILENKRLIMEQYYAGIQNSIPNISNEDLTGIRAHTSSALFYHMVLKAYVDPIAGESLPIINRNFELMQSLRKSVIGEQVKRGIYE